MALTYELSQHTALSTACAALGVPRATLYRREQKCVPKIKTKRIAVNALSSAERKHVLDILTSDRFADQSVNETWGTLIDEGQYLAAPRTMYRVLAENQLVSERRQQLRHPVYQRPELMATAPNQVWSWDITKLRLGHVGQYAFLYVLIDIYSRFVVAWMIAPCESAERAEQLILDACARQHIARAQLTIHADNGSPMVAHSVRDLMSILGVAESHSRPHVPNDNPYSESHFKTLKYHPSFPDRFADFASAHAWARTFFNWYNTLHHHTALKLLTPATVHAGLSTQFVAQRQAVMDAAVASHPERFSHARSLVKSPPPVVYINPPKLLLPSSAPQSQEVIPTV